MPLTGHLDSDSIDWVESISLSTIYIATLTPGASSLDDTAARYPPIHFPVYPYLRMKAAYPRASWDVFNSMLHTGTSNVSGFVGVVFCQVFNDRESGSLMSCMGRVGIAVRAFDMGCRVFQWEELQSILANASQAELFRFHSEIPPANSVYWEFWLVVVLLCLFPGGASIKVCASLQNEAAMAISSELVGSVHIEVFSKYRSGLRVGS